MSTADPNQASAVPPGYWMDANGSLVPVAKIKDIDKDRTRTVKELCEAAKVERSRLAGFKLSAVERLQAFEARSAAEYGVVMRGTRGKGNVTVTTFDGQYKIVRQVQDTITFDERLQVAKELIDQCIQEWSKGSKAEIKALVNNAFQVDKAGKISTTRVLGLRSININDAKWLEAMKAIGDSMQIASSKSYMRFYERDAHTGEYYPISLDVAAL
jgi:hypothetical protein